MAGALVCVPVTEAIGSDEASVRWPWKPDLAGIDSRLIKAAEIAEKRAEPKMTWYCWRYVKEALLAAGAVDARPTSRLANRAGLELTKRFGFKRLPIRDPYAAPVGAVIVYNGDDGGHVEFRCRRGFVSDFISATPYPRPLIGVFVKEPRS
jgi:hypothetical protein